MSNTHEVVILSGVRTAIGTFGGALASVPPTQLGALCAREAIRRAGISAQEVEHTFFGNVIHTETRDMYLSRVVAVEAGIPAESPAMTLNRLCGSGLEAVVSAARVIQLGDAKVALAGGAENMSRGGYLLPSLRWGQRMGEGGAVDMMVGALTDPFGNGHMGITAENIAAKWNISRETQDAFALESQQRAARAIAEGRFKSQILPVEIQDRKKTIVFDTDEHPRADSSIEGLAKLRPAFKKDGVVTAGNASGINDGAAAVVLMEAETAKAKGLKPMARIVAYGHAGVEPSEMGIGPVPAVKNALAKTSLTIDDVDVIESNEAFAAQACAVAIDLKFPPGKTNPNGGAIALGHPIGATGAILLVKTMYELERTGGRYGLVTMCIGGGQGIAMIIERM
ncbi:MAG: acetyl-CoA C-acyltransferase family protein [Lewinellaceae bacterium]|nr:acetyl-CoA C-acyltransferase family protein [Lewinellaceae bacterium]